MSDTSEETQKNKEEKREQPDNPNSSILELNAAGSSQQQQQTQQVEVDIDLDDVLANQQLEQESHIANTGFDMDKWTSYYGSIGERHQQIQAQLAQLDVFKIPYNTSGDYIMAEWQILELKYHPVTTRAYDERQILLAQVDDLTRKQQVQNLKLQELQQALQKRQSERLKPKPVDNGKSNKKLSDMTVDEIQHEISALQDIDNAISRKIQDARIDANWLGFRMYFHKDNKEVYDNCRFEHLDDILKACDHRQIASVVKDSKNSSSSSIPVRAGLH